MKYFILILLLLGSFDSFTQEKTSIPPPPPPPPLSNGGKDIFKVVESMPRFPGCEEEESEEVRKECAMKEMLKFIYSNIEYPAIAEENGVEGTVVIRFIVGRDGEILKPEIVRDIGANCGLAALEVVKKMPNWIPGIQKGEAVKVQFNLPVKFKLTDPSDGIFLVVQEMPKFPGCELTGDEMKDRDCSDTKIIEYFKNNMQYPETAKKFEVEGECQISFVVNEIGEIMDPQIYRDMGAGCGIEALRLIKEMPKWIPGKKDGAPVKVQMILPVDFKL